MNFGDVIEIKTKTGSIDAKRKNVCLQYLLFIENHLRWLRSKKLLYSLKAQKAQSLTEMIFHNYQSGENIRCGDMWTRKAFVLIKAPEIPILIDVTLIAGQKVH